MSDLLNFNDDDDNLFKPQEQPNKPSRNLDDIFGTNPEGIQSDNTLDDILTPSVKDDIFQTKETPKKTQRAVKNVDSLFGDVDDEPDIFSSNTAATQKSESKNIANPLEDDLLSDFLQPSVTKEDNVKSNNDQTDKENNDINDLFGFDQSDSVSQQDNQSRLRYKSHDDISADESADSLDILLSAQPMGSVPSCDDLLSLVDPITNTANSSNNFAALNDNSKDSSNKEKDPLDDFFGDSESNRPRRLPGQSIEEENKPLVESKEKEASKPLEEIEKKQASKPPEDLEEEIKPSEEKEDIHSDSEIEEPPITKPKTNLKKSMERSFEDLLTGLSDESEPELDDMIVADIDNTNLESLLETPDKSKRDSVQTTNKFNTPSKPLDLDLFSSTPMEKSSGSPEVKVTTPDVKVITPDDKEEWADQDGESFNDDDVVMRPKKDYRVDYADEEDDVNLEAIEDTNHLDVDVNKHKSALGKKGSLALRRKPSRKSRKSLLSSGDDAIFQDSTDSRPVSMTNGNDDEQENGDDGGYDLSPPAKKPSPAVMLPLPGMAARPPSQRKLSAEADDDDNAMDTKEVKRSSKPPPGAFVLPSFSPSPAKPRRSPSGISDQPPVDTKPAVFEKPALRSVKPVEKSQSPEQDEKPVFSRAGLKSSKKSETKDDNEERDMTFQKPTLRSTPKPQREKSPENMDIGVFEKPQLRSTPKPKLEQKITDDKDNDVFEQSNLRSVQKQEIDIVKDTSSEKHVFEKPSLRSTGRKIDNDFDLVKEETDSKTFEKPALRTTKPPKADSVNDSSEPVHTFDKPPLRSTSRPSVEKNSDSSSSGVFEKPSLKKTTPSPEKEAKDINESKGMFDKPALRKTERERKESPKVSEKPEWLQQAANKHSKVLGAVHTKENSHNHIEKETPSWLEKSVLRKTRGQPLQDSSNGQSSSSSHSGLSHTDDRNKELSTPRSRNSSVNSDSEQEKKSTSASTAKESHNNYTPSWMRQTRSPSVPTPGVLGPAKSLPSLSGSSEVPSWKRELAQRRQNRKEKSSEEVPKKEVPVEPDWKKGIQLRKTRITPQSAKDSSEEVKSVEPEWKKAAEEKHARLRSKSVQYAHLKFT